MQTGDVQRRISDYFLAYFEQKSTVDYIGAAQGIPIAFDAKECAKDTFTLANIHQNQVDFMENISEGRFGSVEHSVEYFHFVLPFLHKIHTSLHTCR